MLDKQKLIDFCKSQVGYHEKKSNKDLDDKKSNSGSANYTKYAKFFDDLRKQGVYVFNYEKNPVEWCAVYAIYCCCMAYSVDTAVKMLYLPVRSSAAGAKEFAQIFKDHKAFKKTAEAGDVVFFGSDGKIKHVGLVTKVTDKMIYTNEGNVNNQVVEKSYRKDNKSIIGYGVPDWSAKTTEEKPKTEPATPAKPKQSSPEVKYKVTAPHGLRLREGAGTNYPVIMIMAKDSTFVATKQFGEWVFGKAYTKKGEYLGIGYAHTKWLKKI